MVGTNCVGDMNQIWNLPFWGFSQDDIVDLKQLDSQIFLQQNGFIWEQQRVTILDMWSTGQPWASPENKGEEGSFIEQRGEFIGAVVNKKSIGGNGVWSVVVFHWSYNSLSLVNSLSSRQSPFFWWSSRVEKYLAGDEKYLSSHSR